MKKKPVENKILFCNHVKNHAKDKANTDVRNRTRTFGYCQKQIWFILHPMLI